MGNIRDGQLNVDARLCFLINFLHTELDFCKCLLTQQKVSTVFVPRPKI